MAKNENDHLFQQDFHFMQDKYQAISQKYNALKRDFDKQKAFYEHALDERFRQMEQFEEEVVSLRQQIQELQQMEID
eukprot:CAMPEP_0202979562 /NCGR_PEP_ID=MMETSP1396-20130829/85675_1 /ASSEMBLY_ACC=CAM_ASM_000872 /TAXON_ID= /ORGANISM="Pseudokeronopsis sp., Strain Brazil" /LENGTH=76 /DNA_ID=CAMNT_0049719039 /DNA_START=614 /DNA_END=844 /DNA_ORIENTATION=-